MSDIILIGEDHTRKEHLSEIRKIILENSSPKAVLYEGCVTEIKGKRVITTEELQKITGVEVPSKEPWYLWNLEELYEYLDRLTGEILETSSLSDIAYRYGDTSLHKELSDKSKKYLYISERLGNYFSILCDNFEVGTPIRAEIMYSDIANNGIPVLPLDDNEAKREQTKLLKLLRQGVIKEDKGIKKLNEKREEKMAENIIKAVEKYGTPVIAVMGAHHLNGVKKRLEGGLIRKLFKRGYNVKTIDLNLDKPPNVEDRIKAFLYTEKVLE